MAAQPQESSRAPSSGGMDSIPIVQGAIAGALSFVGGYLVTLVLVAAVEAEEIAEELIEVSGWIFYNAQFVGTEQSAGGQTQSVNYVTGNVINLDVPALVYHLIPVVLLVLAGIVVARQAGAVEIGEGAMAGATLVAGVAVLALVGTFVFTVSESALGATVETGPPLVESLLFVGVGYPVVLGAVGGAIGTQL